MPRLLGWARQLWPEAPSYRDAGDRGPGPAIVKTAATTTSNHSPPAVAQPPRARVSSTTAAFAFAVAVAVFAASVSLTLSPNSPQNTARVSELRVENIDPAPSMARVYAGRYLPTPSPLRSDSEQM